MKPVTPQQKHEAETLFRAYTIKCMSLCRNEKEKSLVQKHIKTLKEDYTYNGLFYKHDWSKEPLPHFLADSHNISSSTSKKDSDHNGSGNGEILEFYEDRKGRKRNNRNNNNNSNNNNNTSEKHAKRARKGNHSDSDGESSSDSNSDNKSRKGSKKKGNPKKKAEKDKKLYEGDSEEVYQLVVTRERIVGTSTQLEKPYTRTTGLPRPETVRPEHVLKQAVEYVTKKWERTKDFTYVNEQFKSIRQDLTVQGIKDDFTVFVYEKHAKITLSEGCMEEFNKCSVKLEHLYTLPGISTANEPEFTAYRIFYLALIDDTALLSELYKRLYSPRCAALRIAHPVSQALDIVNTFERKDWPRYFRVTKAVDNMGHSIIEKLTQNVRLTIVKNVTSSFACNVSVDFVGRRLGFESREETMEYLAFLGVSPEADGSTLVTKRVWEAIKSKSLKSLEIDNINMQIMNESERN